MNTLTTPDPLHERLMQALQAVADPEIGESIVDLGLVQTLEIAPAAVHLRLLPTSATCPMADVLMEEAHAALSALLPPAWDVTVEMDWDEVWTPERLAPALRERFGWTP